MNITATDKMRLRMINCKSKLNDLKVKKFWVIYRVKFPNTVPMEYHNNWNLIKMNEEIVRNTETIIESL